MNPNQKRKRTHRHTAEEGSSPALLLQSSAVGMGAALLCAMLLLLLGSLLCLRSSDPSKLLLPLGLGALYLSSLLGGIVTVRRHKSAVLLCGALCGVLLLGFFWVLSLFFQAQDRFSLPLSLLLRALVAVFSILGAFLGQKRSSKRLRRKR